MTPVFKSMAIVIVLWMTQSRSFFTDIPKYNLVSNLASKSNTPYLICVYIDCKSKKCRKIWNFSNHLPSTMATDFITKQMTEA